MSTKKGVKISVVGAGSVGATTAYVLMLSELANELVLVDVNKKKADGEALDLNDGVSFVKPTNIVSGTYEDTKDSDIVVITAGSPQKPGETRLDLVNKNVKIFRSIIPDVAKNSPNAILLVIANPVDVLSYVAYKLSGFPKERVIGSGTVLDTSRLKYQIAKHFDIDSRDVNTYIMGEHGDSEIAAWSLTNIANINIEEYAKKTNNTYDEKFRTEAYEKVKNAAYEVINRKGATFYAIALAARRIVQAILGDENAILPVSTLIKDYYGINDIYLSVPCIVGADGMKKMLPVELSKEESGALVDSATTLKATLDSAAI